jgi:hypothetical protein
MTDTAAWPYDAIQDDPLTALRIPVTAACPRRCYLAAFHGVPDPILDREPLGRPTAAEARVLVSLIDYLRQRYRAPWPARMLAEPLDADGGHNTHIFHKFGEDDWGYRWSSWDSPRFSRGRSKLPLTLVQAIDRCRLGDRAWEAWKAAHPEVFGDA